MNAFGLDWPIESGTYADLVTAPGFKPGVTSAKTWGGFDSHPFPFGRLCPFGCARSKCLAQR